MSGRRIEWVENWGPCIIGSYSVTFSFRFVQFSGNWTQSPDDLMPEKKREKRECRVQWKRICQMENWVGNLVLVRARKSCRIFWGNRRKWKREPAAVGSAYSLSRLRAGRGSWKYDARKKIGLDQKWHSHTHPMNGMKWGKNGKNESLYLEKSWHIYAQFSLSLFRRCNLLIPFPFPFPHFSHSKNRVARWTETGGALDAKAYTDGEMGQIRTSAFYTEKKNLKREEKMRKTMDAFWMGRGVQRLDRRESERFGRESGKLENV